MHLKFSFSLVPGIGSLPLGLGVLLLHSQAARATPTFETVQAFVRSPENPHAKLVLGSDGNFYGTTENGGRGGKGTVFRVTPAGALTTLVDFTGANGDGPASGLLQGRDGNFYGTTTSGGSGNYGTVFKMTPKGVLSTLVNFNAADGAWPQAALVQGRDGNFYGTTSADRGTHEDVWGAAYGEFYGTAFKMTPAGVLTTLASFPRGNPRGGYPQGDLVQGRDGSFYGTTSNGGVPGVGTVFKITPAGVLTILASFDGLNGMTPTAGLSQDRDGNFYGSTSSGEVGTLGTIFKVTPAGALTTLVQFCSSDEDEIPENGLIWENIGFSADQTPCSPKLLKARDGNFYATTHNGGYLGYGTVFKMTPGGTVTLLAKFDGENGKFPDAELVQGNDGNFYGTTSSGGKAGHGTVFKITAAGVLTTLVNFESSKGIHPYAELIQGSDGNFYGTTCNGGKGDCGTIFKMTTSGALTTLVKFNGANGQYPQAGLMQASDGNFYGTTYGGSDGKHPSHGKVFKMTPAGILTNLNKSDGYPTDYGSTSRLTQGSNGNIYGTASSDGYSGHVFKVKPGKGLVTLVNFDGINGRFPEAGLVQGSDGNFYGTTASGGIGDASHVTHGTVFKMTRAGALTSLVNFTGTNGEYPQAELVQGSDRNFYGTTSGGGSTGNGTVFKMTPAGALTTLVNFARDNGYSPEAGLVQGNDGNFYGTTAYGGLYDHGTVFQVTPSGIFKTVMDFTGANGSHPSAGLSKARDGNLYGTTREGGTTSKGRLGGGGQIYRLRMGPSVTTLAANSVTPSSAQLNATVNPGGYETPVIFQYSTSPTLAGYATFSAGTLAAGAGSFSMQANLTGLSSNTVYYYRAVASNVENTVPQAGPIRSFTTSSASAAAARQATSRWKTLIK